MKSIDFFNFSERKIFVLSNRYLLLKTKIKIGKTNSALKIKLFQKIINQCCQNLYLGIGILRKHFKALILCRERRKGASKKNFNNANFYLKKLIK